MTDITVLRRRHPRRRSRSRTARLHIISFQFATDGHGRRAAAVLVQGRMDQSRAMVLAAAEAGKAEAALWLTGINIVAPPRPTPALDRLCRRHTAFHCFLSLLTAAAGYRPTIRLDFMGRDGLILAGAYDRAQARWNDQRRAFVTGDPSCRRHADGRAGDDQA